MLSRWQVTTLGIAVCLVTGFVALVVCRAASDVSLDLAIATGATGDVRADLAARSSFGLVWLPFDRDWPAEAARRGQPQIALLLLAHGGSAGDALEAAAQYGKWPVAAAVLATRYRIERSALRFCLWRAMAARRHDIVSALLGRGLPADTAQSGEPAICAAAFIGDTESIKLLHKYGASASSVTRSGESALMACTAGSVSESFGVSAQNQIAAARLLLSLGASAAARDRSGHTALQRALRQYGAAPGMGAAKEAPSEFLQPRRAAEYAGWKRHRAKRGDG
ncbi:MAG: ankyrin repeat domain-containing protein [Armatimonadetes bacterium]|nr:ankyrin repeat domain-containing protein [Armatimonadota bacterium]MDE2205757.1 ankyrin repeat domain-containing protein [Armatimonadota bacterium]